MTEQTNPGFNHVLIESRKNIIAMMEERGYDMAPYKKINPHDLVKLSANPDALNMIAKHTKEERSAEIIYVYKSIKLGLAGVVSSAIRKNSPEDEDGNVTEELPEKTDFIYIMCHPVVEAFNQASTAAWTKAKVLLQFFYIKTLVHNPMAHVLQPKFETVPKEEHDTIMKDNYVRSKSQFPIIKYHEDIVARYMGLLPGDLVRITRPSPTAGLYTLYRVCAP